MTPEEFIRRYEAALASQSWAEVDPLVHDDVCVTFSSGAVHKGRAAVRSAFETNFASIEGERYSVTNVHWVLRTEQTSVFVFDFEWSGRIQGQPAQGKGRGTSVLVRDRDEWKLLAEHLGPGA